MSRLVGLFASAVLHGGVIAAVFVVGLSLPVRRGEVACDFRPPRPTLVDLPTPRDPDERVTFEERRPEPAPFPVHDAPLEFSPDHPVIETPIPELPAPAPDRPVPTFDRPVRVTMDRPLATPEAAPSQATALSDAPAIEIHNPPPTYPASARRRGVEGEVVVEIEISAEGACASATVAKSSNHEMLDEAALSAVKAWRFRAATKGGKAVASVQRVRFVFTLKG